MKTKIGNYSLAETAVMNLARSESCDLEDKIQILALHRAGRCQSGKEEGGGSEGLHFQRFDDAVCLV